jgi:predicted nucleotidyltransferase
VNRSSLLEDACRRHSLDALYIFGSRADDGLRALEGEAVPRDGSDLDVGVLFIPGVDGIPELPQLQVALEDVFEPLRVDLVPLDRVDALFQYRAIEGHRLHAADSGRVDRRELVIMRRASDLLPVQRALERDLFGVTSS